MILNIKNVLNNNFYKIINKIKILEPNHHGYLFDYSQKLKLGETKNAYIGEKLCGEACFVVSRLLKPLNYDIKVKYNSNYKIKNIDDHCFILINNSIYVDPTYKQFLKYNIKDNNKSINYLYNELDPFFIGKREDLMKIIDNSFVTNKKIIQYWDIHSDISNKFIK